MNDALRDISQGKAASEQPHDWKALLEVARKALAQAIEIRVSATCIQPMKGQPREHFNHDSIMRLVESIRSVGQVYPGIVRKIGEDHYELLDGERRWRAISLVGIQYRALLVEIDNEAAPFLIAAIANFNREAHTPLEIVDSIIKMHVEFAMPMTEVAKVLGITNGWAGKMFTLRKLHPEVRKMMDVTLPKKERLPVTAALQIASMKHELQPQLARRTISKDVSLSGLRQEVVRVSKSEGAYIRKRTSEPSGKWEIVARRFHHLRRFMGDFENSLNDPDIAKMVRSRIEGFDLEKANVGIQDLQRILSRCEKILENATHRS